MYEGSDCCAVCCPHHVFGEKYERNGYAHFGRIEKVVKDDDEKDPARFTPAFTHHQQKQLAFCSAFEKRLLPELRTIVYTHLLSSSTTQHVLESHAHRLYCHSCTSYFFPRSRMPVDPAMRQDVWRFSAYTGDVIGKEIAEAWYRNSRFMVYVGDGLMDRWLSEDVWERGIIPANVVRDVVVHVEEAACEDLDVRKKYEGHSAREELGMLKRLGNKRVELVIEIELMRLGALRAVAETVYELRDKGFVNVKVRAHCAMDCRARENMYFRGVRKDWCRMGCKMRDIGYVFDVKEEVFDEVFAEGQDFLDMERFGGLEHLARWRKSILAGEKLAVVRYAGYTAEQRGAVSSW